MRLLLAVLLLSAPALAQDKRAPAAKDQDLKKESSASPDKSLAGDLTRKKEEGDKKAPTLQYDQFRLGVELQVASKRHSLIEQLQKIIPLTSDEVELPKLHFQLAELYWEESKFIFFEANRKDDDLINAMNRKDKAGMEKAKAEKAALIEQQKVYVLKAQGEYKTIVSKFKNFERMDEVLFFLGNALMEQGEDRNALVVYKRLVDKYPKSKFLADAWVAFGEYYFNTSKGRREMLERALQAYQKAASYTDSQSYLFAIYKQGWCHFNMGDFRTAMDKYKFVVQYIELNPSVEKEQKSKAGLAKEARNDYVRAYERIGGAGEAREDFKGVSSDPETRFGMMKALANLYYEDGKDRDAAVAYNILIKDRPTSPDSPGFQAKIVDCVLRAGNKQQTVAQVRRLVKITQDVEASGVIKDDKDKDSLQSAKELSERTLSNLAVTWHNEAKKTRDDEVFGLSSQVYADYLTLFPDNPKAYDLRFFWAELLNDNLLQFEKAANQYTIVSKQDIDRMEKGEKNAKGELVKGKPGKWFTNALYNAILAYDEVVKKEDEAAKDKPPPTNQDFTKKLEISPTKVARIEACDRYIKYQPKGEKRVEIMYKAANDFYQANHFDEAVIRFSEIALGYPDYKFETGERAGEIAANLILDSYNALSNWEKVNEWARKFYANDKLAVGKFRDDLSKLIESSAFKLVNQLEAKKDFAKAGDAYLNFVAEFPRSEIADKALFNASIDFHNAKMRDKAIQVRNRIIKDYPRSEFVPKCVFANAQTHEAVGDFEEAASQYERYVAGYERSLADGKGGKGGNKSKAPPPKRGKKGAPAADEGKKVAEQKWEEDKAQTGLFNAGVFREGLGQYKQALKNRERYLELWPPEGKAMADGEKMFLSIADLYEKMGLYNKALAQLEEYERKWMRDPSKVLTAEGRIVGIFAEKLKKPRDVARVNGRILKYYDDLGGKAKKSLEPLAMEAVARAHLESNEADFRFYTSYKVRWGRMPHPEAEFKPGLAEKVKRLKVVQEDFTKTVQFKAGDPAICALYKIGLAYANFVDTLTNAPMPRGIPAEAKEEFEDAIRAEVAQNTDPLKQKAAEAFTAAVQKANELDIHNECSRKSLALLRETYAPDQFPEMPEAKVELASAKEPVIGGDILTAIQEVPVMTVAEAELAKEKAKEIREQTKDLSADDPKKIKTVDEEPPEPKTDRAADPKTPPKNTSSNGNDEPEDILE